jgi:hypothetical protein
MLLGAEQPVIGLPFGLKSADPEFMPA